LTKREIYANISIRKYLEILAWIFVSVFLKNRTYRQTK